MRVLVTGGHGFLGSHLVRALLARGAEVRCLSRSPGVPEALGGLGVEILLGDVRDPLALNRAVAGVDAIYHLAALTRSLSAREMRDVNVGGTARLVAAAVSQGFTGRFVYCSSLAAVGPAAAGRPQTEEAPYRPLTWYGGSKAEAERLLRASSDRLAVTIVRPPTVYGPRERDLLALFQAAARGLAPSLEPSPQSLSLVYAVDLAEGMIAVGESPATVGGTYFLTHEEILTPSDLTAGIAASLGRPLRPLRVPAGAAALLGRVLGLVSQITGSPALLNPERLKEMRGEHWTCTSGLAAAATGWRARTPLAVGLASTLAWYRENGWL